MINHKPDHFDVLPDLIEEQINPSTENCIAILRSGELCPICGVEQLEYDGLLNLSCPVCGVASGGSFT